jgi:hypothetical protein
MSPYAQRTNKILHTKEICNHVQTKSNTQLENTKSHWKEIRYADKAINPVRFRPASCMDVPDSSSPIKITVTVLLVIFNLNGKTHFGDPRQNDGVTSASKGQL